MTIPEIKKILKAKGLSRAGNKGDLIATYLDNVGMTTRCQIVNAPASCFA
jgi:hypothetical protein